METIKDNDLTKQAFQKNALQALESLNSEEYESLNKAINESALNSLGRKLEVNDLALLGLKALVKNRNGAKLINNVLKNNTTGFEKIKLLHFEYVNKKGVNISLDDFIDILDKKR